MNVLFFTSSLIVGGTEKKTVKVANELAARGLGVHLAYLSDPSTLMPEISSKVRTSCLRRSGKFSFRALQNLRNLVEDHNIDVIMCMNQYPLLYAWIVKALARRSSLRILLSINTTEFERKRDRWFMLIYKPMMRRVEKIIYGCEYQKSLWQDRYGLNDTQSQVIYNGVDTEAFNSDLQHSDIHEEFGLGGSFVIGCVARLSPEKNQEALLQAAANLARSGRKCNVLLVGAGPRRDKLKAFSLAAGIADRVHFLGRLSDVRSALAAMDVFVLPSVSVETFSNAALEAMAMARPVILSNIAGAQEMVTNGYDGFLYEKNDVERLTKLLIRLHDDVELRTMIGLNARKTVVENFSFARMAATYRRVIQKA